MLRRGGFYGREFSLSIKERRAGMSGFEAARRQMVDCQVRPSDVTQYAIIDAMLTVPRERFVPKAKREIAYAGIAVEVAEGRVLLDPRVFSKMLEAAQIGPDDVVLDVACGTGYSTAVIAQMAATVVAVEGDAGLAALARDTLADLEVHNAVVEERAPTEGAPEAGLYDAILVNGGVEQVPDALSAQLKQGGRLVALFQDGDIGQCRVLTRTGEGVTSRWIFDAVAPVLPGFERERSFEF